MDKNVCFPVLCYVKYAKSVFGCVSVCVCLTLTIYSTYLHVDIPLSINLIFISVYTDICIPTL